MVERIKIIRQNCDKRGKGSTGQPDPTTQLVEIETYINKILKFVQLAKIADPQTVQEKMRKLQNYYKEVKRGE